MRLFATLFVLFSLPLFAAKPAIPLKLNPKTAHQLTLTPLAGGGW